MSIILQVSINNIEDGSGTVLPTEGRKVTVSAESPKGIAHILGQSAGIVDVTAGIVDVKIVTGSVLVKLPGIIVVVKLPNDKIPPAPNVTVYRPASNGIVLVKVSPLGNSVITSMDMVNALTIDTKNNKGSAI